MMRQFYLAITLMYLFLGKQTLAFGTKCLLKRTRTIRRLFASSNNESGDRPPIIPYDFARDDINPSSPEAKSNENALATAKPEISKSGWTEDPARPTGYASDDDSDDWIPSVSPDDSPVAKFLKDYFFDNEFDSMKRKDAKFVARNITLFSFLIGVIFTVIYYAFPGKFIGYKADMNFSSRYESTFADPSGLLGDGGEWLSPGAPGEFFDDAKNLPSQEQSRYAIPSSSASVFPTASPRTEDI
jgi:hypothetical protein